MDAALTPLYEDSLKKAKDIYTVFGWLGIVGSLVFVALLVALPAKTDSDTYGKLGMAVFTLVLAAGSALRIRAGRRYEANVRETFAHPERVRKVILGQSHGRGVFARLRVAEAAARITDGNRVA